MKRILFLFGLTLLTVSLNFSSCKKAENDLTPVTLDLSNTQNADPMQTLGRVLFYDTHLSVNNSISCGSCHRQALAFSDNVAFSRGFENKLTSRNSIPIQNINSNFFGFPTALFWDGRETMLTSMVLQPIVNHVEMGMDNIDDVTARVNALPYYRPLFNNAFNSTEISADRIANALASFTQSIVSVSSRFFLSQNNQVQLNAQELFGKQLFFEKYDCNSCHQTQMLNGYEMGGGFVNIGLDPVYSDNGLGARTHNPADNGKFKIPDLHNVALTAPYMHDGRFNTLSEVLDHYSHGISGHPNLDDRLKDANNQPMAMNISSTEKDAIITFLHALSDFSITTNPDLANPFK